MFAAIKWFLAAQKSGEPGCANPDGLGAMLKALDSACCCTPSIVCPVKVSQETWLERALAEGVFAGGDGSANA